MAAIRRGGDTTWPRYDVAAIRRHPIVRMYAWCVQVCRAEGRRTDLGPFGNSERLESGPNPSFSPRCPPNGRTRPSESCRIGSLPADPPGAALRILPHRAPYPPNGRHRTAQSPARASDRSNLYAPRVHSRDRPHLASAHPNFRTRPRSPTLAVARQQPSAGRSRPRSSAATCRPPRWRRPGDAATLSSQTPLERKLVNCLGPQNRPIPRPKPSAGKSTLSATHQAPPSGLRPPKTRPNSALDTPRRA